MSVRRDALKVKIAGLRAKTRAAGCTEAEALAAAALAAELMARHGLDEADMVMTDATARETSSAPTWRNSLCETIATCTNTAVIMRPADSAITFVGRDPGPEIALYLRDVCFRAVRTEERAFKASTFYRRRRSLSTRRQAADDFRNGLVLRLQDRLRALYAVVRSDDAIAEAKQALQRQFPNRVTVSRTLRPERYSEAGTAGWLAGGAVALNRGVGGAAAPKRIGGA